MSAEILRRAATRIRHDVEFGQEHGDPKFLLAVADWLEREAQWADVDAANSPMDEAVGVARAYLGKSA